MALAQLSLRNGIIPFYPELKGRYAIGNAQVATLYSAFIFASLLLQLPAGYAADRFSPRRIVFWSLIGLAGSSVLFIYSPTFITAWLARALMGAFAVWIYPAAARMIRTGAPEDQQGRLFSVWESGVSFSGFLSLTLGPVLASSIGINSTQLGLVVVALATVGLVWLAGQSWEAGQGGVRRGAGAPVGEDSAYYSRYSMARRVFVISAISFLLMIPYCSITVWYPTYLRTYLGLSMAASGIVMGILNILSIFALCVAGRYSDKKPRLWVSNLGNVIITVGLLLLLPGPGLPVTVIAGAFVVVGGVVIFPSQASFIVSLLGPARAGLAASLLVLSAGFGVLVSSISMGWLLDLTGRFSDICWIALICIVLRALATRPISEAPRPML